MKILISYENRVRPDTTGNYFRDAFKRLGHSVTHVLPENIFQASRDYDLYVKIDDGIYSAWNPALHPSAYYCIDTHIETDWRVKIANEGEFDSVHVCHPEGQSLPFKVVPTHTPVACDPDIHYAGQRKKKYDVCFIGNFHSQYAQKRINAVDRAFKVAPNFFFGSRTFKEMAEKFAESKIVLNCSMNSDVNMRFFEALCSGSALLTDRIPQIKTLGFLEDHHYFAYGSEDELEQKIRTLLSNDAYREQVASNGRALVLEQHTYAHRAQKIIEGIKTPCLR